MEQPSRTYEFAWRGIAIRVIHTPRRWSAIEHLEIRSVTPVNAPLPISGTGYRSHFTPIGTVAAHGGKAVAQVTAWLDEEATTPEWRALHEASQHGELF